MHCERTKKRKRKKDLANCQGIVNLAFNLFRAIPGFLFRFYFIYFFLFCKTEKKIFQQIATNTCQLLSCHNLYTVAPDLKVPNQLLGTPIGPNVELECYVEAFPNTINYWQKDRSVMLLDG